MKQFLSFCLFLLTVASLFANENSSSLKPGDWFTLEFANRLEDYSSPVDSIDYCSPDNLKQLVLKCKVLYSSNDKLKLQFFFERLFHLESNGEYFDSYFKSGIKYKNGESKFSMDVDIDNNKNSYEFYIPKDSIGYYPYSTFSRKVDIAGSSMTSTETSKYALFDSIESLILSYVDDWQKQEFKLPLPSSGNVEIAEYKSYRILEANIPVKANTKLTVHGDNLNESEEVELFAVGKFDIEKDRNSIIPSSIFVKNGKIQFSFYLEKQKQITFKFKGEEIKLVATPNQELEILLDSTNVQLPLLVNETNNGDNKYQSYLSTSQINFHIKSNDLRRINSLDSALIFIEKEQNFQIKTLQQFKNEMTANWYRKQLKKIYYWSATNISYWHEFHNHQLNFSQFEQTSPFSNINPLYDYYFELEQYDTYLRILVKNSRMLSFESVEINQGFTRSFNQNENYDMINTLYWGYPKYYTLKNIVRQDLESNGIKTAIKNYNRFVENCAYPPFITEVKDVYSEIERIEPGKSLLDLKLSFIKNENFKTKNGKYKIVNFIFVSPSQDEIDKLLQNVSHATENLNLKDKVELYFVYCEKFTESSLKKTLGKKDDFNIVFIEMVSDKEFSSDRNLLKLWGNTLLLLSPENVIISRNCHLFLIREEINRFIDSQNQPTSQVGNSRLLLVILASLIGFGLLSWIIIRIRTNQISKKEAAKRKLSELELRAIRSQMNPHFMFNSLNSIQNLVNKNKIEETNVYLSEFAEMMRLVLNNSEKQLVSLEEELKLIESYLKLEKLRLPFEFEISVDPMINPAEEEIPGMLIQPFVENAVVHGIAPQKGGKIKVSFVKDKERIICEISDDGIGISKRSEQRNGNGKAIKMIRERINIVNSQTTEPLTLEIIDREDLGEKGTLVKIEIPV